ncbi:MAG: CDP-glycerol glycerophosphotransferase family protein [bacterium]|nr:CDP-glycerol glycerophosphotransferase family protein [bacterium]MDZ4299397.1 CDP-glycerol glycerophosphotransferase family protein [Candidatus Sungbacteria bacterium]
MKTILIKFDNSFFVRNFLRTDAFRMLAEVEDTRIVFLAPAEKITHYRREFSSPRVFFETLPETKHFLSERFFKFIETASIHSHTVSMMHRTEYARTAGQKLWIRRAVLYAIRRGLWRLGRYRLWRACIRRVYFLLPSRTFSCFFDAYQPDLVFSPSMAYTDGRMLKEARHRGVKTIGMVLSWDNLYSKTMLRVFSDILVVHTDEVRDQAVKLGDYPRERVVVSGIPQYDCYFRRTDIIPREQFIQSIGGDPRKKLIVYAVSGKAGLHIDYAIVKLLQEAIRRGEIKTPAQLLLRAHPRYDFSPVKIKQMREEYGCLVQPAMGHVGESRDNWEFDAEAVSFLANTLAHADVVVALYTTFFIEAALFNKPLIAVGFDAEEMDYWNSARHFFEWDHLRELDRLGGIWRVESREELIRAVNTGLENPKHLEEGRRRITLHQSQFTDGKSGERLGRIILAVLSSS